MDQIVREESPSLPLGPVEELTAVEKFALQQDFQQLPQSQRLYEELIPKTTPGPGEQYAFAVDLDRCTGCKACITACHNENGLEEDESWRSVGVLYGGTSQKPILQHVTTGCHHCLDPACLNGCPVNAYEKDAATGIVKHLDDQCIGCQYCTFTCPYDVPKYSRKKGIVHKCDMCLSRLEVGQAPACVRSCPNGAIRIGLVETASVRENPEDYVKITHAPDSHYTLPTTRYTTQKGLPENMVSPNFYSVKPEHSHMPLIVMLVLTQLSVGAFWAVLFLKNHVLASFKDILIPYHVLIALGAGLVALGASLFHLGRPLYAFRAIVGLKRSWLSREIVLFGIFALWATVYALGAGMSLAQGAPTLSSLGPKLWKGLMDILAFATAGVGTLGVFSSVKVYQKTHRPFWDNPLTAFKFFLTMGILGCATVFFTTIILALACRQIPVFSIMQEFGTVFCGILAVMTTIKIFLEIMIFLHLDDRELTALKKTALLMTGPFKKVTLTRFICGAIGGIFLPVLFLIRHSHLGWGGILGVSGLIFLLSFTGEFLERYLFFRTVVPFRMPGGKDS